MSAESTFDENTLKRLTNVLTVAIAIHVIVSLIKIASFLKKKVSPGSPNFSSRPTLSRSGTQISLGLKGVTAEFLTKDFRLSVNLILTQGRQDVPFFRYHCGLERCADFFLYTLNLYENVVMGRTLNAEINRREGHVAAQPLHIYRKDYQTVGLCPNLASQVGNTQYYQLDIMEKAHFNNEVVLEWVRECPIQFGDQGLREKP
ncbi:hypothetical protein Fcan01_11530 [Folsomia candida]|uniref:Uncharacterized protein n=1 Tax=Folsomia candida TaxID=158441 RepID=A0A226E8U0_FOLCA|nr:hypothetical protein Fcan01_11530 [Folsomia candida]